MRKPSAMVVNIVGGMLALGVAGKARTAPETDALQLQEVVVTAQRVESSEQKTPVAMEVLSQHELVTKGIVDVQSLAETDASVNFDTGAGAGFITMRGLSGAPGLGGAGFYSPAVPIAFDGFYYNTNFIFNDSLYDVDRIEVLRGPQGTLFGRNSTGGLINVLTKNPGHDFSADGRLTLGSYSEIDAEGALNVPMSDRLQMRFAFTSAHHSGYRNLFYHNGAVGDDQDSKSGRVKVAWEPLDALKVLISFQMTHVGGAGATDNIVNLPADAANFPTHVAIPLTGGFTRTYNLAFPFQVNIDDKLVQWHLTYDALPWGMTLTYLGGYDRMDYLHSSPVVGLDAVQYGIPTTVELLSTLDPATQNQELRLESARDRAVTWQAGLYYFHGTLSHNYTHFRDITTPAAADLVQFLYSDEQWSMAGYGQSDWHLGPTTFSAGIRYTRDYIQRTDLTSPGDGIFPATQETQYPKVTWHLGENWDVTDHNMAYVKVDTGYSAGAFNLNVPCNCTGGPPQPTTVEPYRPEVVTTYELGSKNRLLDNHLMLNADVFYARYGDKQLTESNQGGSFTVNANVANIYGLESSVAALGDFGRLDLSAAWMHARFDEQMLSNALLQPFELAGHHLTQAPDLSVTAGFEHPFRFPGGTVTPRVETIETCISG